MPCTRSSSSRSSRSRDLAHVEQLVDITAVEVIAEYHGPGGLDMAPEPLDAEALQHLAPNASALREQSCPWAGSGNGQSAYPGRNGLLDAVTEMGVPTITRTAWVLKSSLRH